MTPLIDVPTLLTRKPYQAKKKQIKTQFYPKKYVGGWDGSMLAAVNNRLFENNYCDKQMQAFHFLCHFSFREMALLLDWILFTFDRIAASAKESRSVDFSGVSWIVMGRGKKL